MYSSSKYEHASTTSSTYNRRTALNGGVGETQSSYSTTSTKQPIVTPTSYAFGDNYGRARPFETDQ